MCKPEPDAKRYTLKAITDDLWEQIHDLKIFNKYDEINQYCDDLESHVMLTVESLMKQLIVLQGELLSDISKYRQDLLAQENQPSQTATDQVDLEIGQLSQDILELEKKYAFDDSESVTDYETIAQAKSLSDKLSKRIREAKKETRKKAFDNKFMRFRANKITWLDSSIVGRFEIAKEDIQDENHSKC